MEDNELQDKETGQRYEPVEPGSPDDPFTKGASVPSEATQQVVDPSAKPLVNAQPPVGEPAAPAVTVEPQPSQEPKQEATPEPTAQVSEPKTTPESEPADDEELTPEQEEDLLTRLNEFLEEQTKGALRQQQSSYDRTINRLQETITASNAAVDELKQQVRNLQLEKLPPEEQERMKAIFEQDDRSAQLDQWQNDLEGYHRDLVTTSYLTEFNRFGITAEMLGECESPEDMEILCLEAKADFFEKRGTAEPAGEEPQAARPPAAPSGVSANVRPAATETPETRAVPAGASATSPVGGEGAPPEQRKFSEEQSPSALTENLKNLPVEQVRLPR